MNGIKIFDNNGKATVVIIIFVFFFLFIRISLPFEELDEPLSVEPTDILDPFAVIKSFLNLPFL